MSADEEVFLSYQELMIKIPVNVGEWQLEVVEMGTLSYHELGLGVLIGLCLPNRAIVSPQKGT